MKYKNVYEELGSRTVCESHFDGGEDRWLRTVACSIRTVLERDMSSYATDDHQERMRGKVRGSPQDNARRRGTLVEHQTEFQKVTFYLKNPEPGYISSDSSITADPPLPLRLISILLLESCNEPARPCSISLDTA